MITFELYQDSNNLWNFNNMIIPTGNIAIVQLSDTEVDFRWVYQNMASIFPEHILISNILKENGDPYGDLATLLTDCAKFFDSSIVALEARVSELEDLVIALLPENAFITGDGSYLTTTDGKNLIVTT